MNDEELMLRAIRVAKKLRTERDNAARFAQRISKAYLHVGDELDLMRENLRIANEANEANRLSEKHVQELEEECDALTKAYQKLWRRWDAFRTRVQELEELETRAYDCGVYDYNTLLAKYNALRDAVREEIGEKTLEALDEIVNTESGSYSDAHLEDSESGGGKSRQITGECDSRPAALGKLLVRDGVPYRFGVGPACMGVQFELTDSPADVPYKLAWDWWLDCAKEEHRADGLYEVHHVGDCEKCRGSKKEDVIKYDPPSYRIGQVEKINCLRCYGNGGRYELRTKESEEGK